MQKLKHKIAVIALIICFASICPMPICSADIPVVQETSQDVFENDATNVKDIDIDPINTEKVKKHVVPDTKNEIKKVIGLFIRTMTLVVLFAIIIYVALIFVKKYHGSSFAPPADDDEYDNLELNTPDDKISALKSFLNRTK